MYIARGGLKGWILLRKRVNKITEKKKKKKKKNLKLYQGGLLTMWLFNAVLHQASRQTI